MKALVAIGAIACLLSWAPLYALVGPWGCVAVGIAGLLGAVAAVNYAFYGRAMPPEER